MVYFIANWVFSVIALLLVAGALPGVRVSDFSSALLAAGVVGLLSAGLGSILKSVSGPFSVAAWSAFLLIADAVLFRFSALVVPGFAMTGLLPAGIGAVVLLALNAVLLRVPLHDGPLDHDTRSWQRL